MKHDFQRPIAVNCSTDMPKFLNDFFEYENIPAGHNRADFFAELLNIRNPYRTPSRNALSITPAK